MVIGNSFVNGCVRLEVNLSLYIVNGKVVMLDENV